MLRGEKRNQILPLLLLLQEGSRREDERPLQMQIWPWFHNSLSDLWPFSGQPKLWNYASITSHLICITLITTEQATLSVNANLLINKLIRQLQLCRRMPKWNMTTQSLSTAPVGLLRCHNEKYDDKVVSLNSQVLIPAPGSAQSVKILSSYLAWCAETSCRVTCNLFLPEYTDRVCLFKTPHRERGRARARA